MSKRLLTLMSMIAALSGCAMGPDYVRPAAPVPADWGAATRGESASAAPGATSSVTPGTAAVPQDWRKFFPDPRLQALIGLALEHNRDLRIATARIAEARALYGIQGAERWPNVDLSAGRSASLTPTDLSPTGRQLNTQRYDVNASVVSYELDFWGRVRRLNEAALASYLSSEAAQRAFRLSLIADVANAYFSQLELDQRVHLAQAVVDNRSAARKLMQQRRSVGIASDLDFLQADSAFETARADLASLERSRAAAANQLQLLVGKQSAELISGLPPGRSLDQQGLTFHPPSGLSSEILLRRPDVLSAEQKLVAANANIGAARAAFLPRITLTGALGTASRSLTGLFESGSGAWSFQPVLRLPLFDAGRTQANVDLTEARQHIAVAEYEKTIQQSFREVADLLAANAQLTEQQTAQERSQQIQTERLRLTEARYQAGVAAYLEVLDVRRDLDVAQQNVLQTRRLLLSTLAQLYKALGG
ncbi:MAG: efflux transporter outer membrane subunit [Betaproteobacteria bacterium]|nr:efflux transporter outer membrane subunit [Betaproteobacteria bacterium]